jgi:hypothetical protein
LQIAQRQRLRGADERSLKDAPGVRGIHPAIVGRQREWKFVLEADIQALGSTDFRRD